MTSTTPTTTINEAFCAEDETGGRPTELVVFALSMMTVIALAIAPHQIGPGF